MLDAEQGWRGAELQHNHLQPLCSTQQREPHRTAPQSPQHPKGGQRGQPWDPNPKPTAFTVRRVPTEPGADVFLSPLFKYRAGATREVKFYNFSLFFFYNNDKNSTNSAETRIYSSLQTPQSLCLRICSSFLTHSILLALRSLSLSLSCHAKIGVDSCIISA